MKKNAFCFLAMLLICCLFASCGGQGNELPAAQGDEATTEAAAPVSEGYGEGEDEPYIIDPEDVMLPVLDAAGALNDGYRTSLTAEEAEEYFDTDASGYGAPVTVFSDNGHALVMLAHDSGMGKTYYRLCFTTDHGETWKQYRNLYPVSGSIEGILTDGQDYWLYGYSNNQEDSYICRVTDHMTPEDNIRSAWLAGYARTAEPEAEHTMIRSVTFDEETQLLRVEAEAYVYDPDYAGGQEESVSGRPDAYRYAGMRPLTAVMIEMDRDLALRGAEWAVQPAG